MKRKWYKNYKKSKDSQIQEIKSLVFRSLILEQQIQSFMITYNARITEKNLCSVTGRYRAVIKDFNLSRIKLKELFNKKLLPGISKSSW